MSPLGEPLVVSAERQVHPALLGFRFWDTAQRKPVREGLRVSARSAARRKLEAFQTPSGVWHFPRLPGVNSVDVAERLAEGLTAAKVPLRYVISVIDSLRRYLPVEFEATAPLAEGLFDWQFGGGAPETSLPEPGYVPLFSTSSRAAPAGFLTVRAELRDAEGGPHKPASWALLEVSVPGISGPETYLGLADAKGKVVVFLPVPVVPVGGPALPLSRRSWDVTVRVWWAPQLTAVAEASLPHSSDTPQLQSILAQREATPARALSSIAPEQELVSAKLHYGETLVLATDPVGLAPRLQSFLLVRTMP